MYIQASTSQMPRDSHKKKNRHICVRAKVVILCLKLAKFSYLNLQEEGAPVTCHANEN